MTRYAFWSTDLTEQTGQNKISKSVIELEEIEWEKFTYTPGSRGIVGWLFLSLKLLLKISKTRKYVIYVVASRSSLGFIRDIPALCSSLFGKRVIVHVHGSDIKHLLENNILSGMARFFYKRATLIIPSPHLLAPLNDLGLSEIILIENFVEGSDVTKSPIREPEQCLHVLWNSNMMASKGLFQVIEACEKYFENGGNITFTVLGRPVRDHVASVTEVSAFVSSYRNRPWFNLIGEIDYQDVRKFLAEADMVCLPSQYPTECQPLALIQGMIFGKQIITCETSALLATVGSYPAIYVEQDSDSICRAFDISLSNIIKKADIEFATSRFSFEKFKNKILSALISD